jgi:hypothetical protein
LGGRSRQQKYRCTAAALSYRTLVRHFKSADIASALQCVARAWLLRTVITSAVDFERLHLCLNPFPNQIFNLQSSSSISLLSGRCGDSPSHGLDVHKRKNLKRFGNPCG